MADVNDYYEPLDWFGDNDDDDNDENEEEGVGEGNPAAGGAFPGAQHCLVLLDCSNEMFAESETTGGRSPMDHALHACEQLVRQRIRTVVTHKTGKRDGFGIVLYNTRYRERRNEGNDDNEEQYDKKKNANGEDGMIGSSRFTQDEEALVQDDNDDDDDDSDQGQYGPSKAFVHELIPLEPPGIRAVKRIRDCLGDPHRGGDRRLDLRAEYGNEGEEEDEGGKGSEDEGGGGAHDHRLPPLQSALCQALQIFQSAKCVKKTTKAEEVEDGKQVWILTVDDDPSGGKDRVLAIFRTTASDLRENDVDIFVWPLPAACNGYGQDFSYERFYRPIGAKSEVSETASAEELLDFEDMAEKMKEQWKKTRRAFALPLLLPDWKDHLPEDEDSNGTQSQTQTQTKTQSQNLSQSQNGGNKKDASKDDKRPTAIMLDWYRLVQISRQPTKVQVHQQTGRELVRMRQLHPTGGGEVLATFRPGRKFDSTNDGEHRRRLRTYVEFGGERVPVSMQDRAAMKRAANAVPDFPSLLLLGFRNADSVPFSHTLEAAYFAYPDDDDVEGGVLAFAHLHRAMLRKNVLAIGELLVRTTATSRLVAVWPLEERSDPDQPPGMLVVGLPFEDEVRALEPDAAVRALEQQRAREAKAGCKEEGEEGDEGGSGRGKDEDEDAPALASEAIVSAFMNLVGKQTIPDVELGEDFDNAHLAGFWDYVEHVALEEPVGSREYDTVLNEEDVLRRVGKQIEALHLCLPEDVRPVRGAAGRKRKLEPDDSGIDWKEVYIEGRLAKCTVADLKKKLRSVGDVLSGKKADLVLRVEKHLEKEFCLAKTE